MLTLYEFLTLIFSYYDVGPLRCVKQKLLSLQGWEKDIYIEIIKKHNGDVYIMRLELVDECVSVIANVMLAFDDNVFANAMSNVVGDGISIVTGELLDVELPIDIEYFDNNVDKIDVQLYSVDVYMDRTRVV